jgi:hypothetical protein
MGGDASKEGEEKRPNGKMSKDCVSTSMALLR